MSHLDPDQLALLAIGEPVASPDDVEHLAHCAECAAELAEMGHAVRIARATIDDDALEAPPERVWEKIGAELGLAARPAEASDASVEESAPTRAAASRPRRRRRSRLMWVLAAALVVVAGAGLTGWALVARLTPTSIAVATLDAFPDHPDAVGSADVEEGRDGSRRLIVTLDAAAVPDAYREVWLIRNDAGALISLGVLDGDRGSFPIPDGVDLKEYSLVDISVEPVDGDPAHSGDSIVRGALSPT
ncbi:anti-sigma factor [Microbacterium sp.]|uniref:anti-sigma factor n=1 Tax=Microbacterium sp. TaxID=51671 RepID=UPI003F6EC119